MGLLDDFQLINEAEKGRIPDNALYYRSDGIIFSYPRLDLTLDSNNFDFGQMFQYAKNAVENIEDSTDKLNEINDRIGTIQKAKIKQIQKLDVIFTALLEAELVDFDNKVGKYLEQFK